MRQQCVHIIFSFVLFFLLGGTVAHADYAGEIQNHIDLIERRFQNQMDLSYFGDMGVVARKSDEATLDEFTTEIISTKLLRTMDEFIDSQIKLAEEMFEQAPYDAVRIVDRLNQFTKFYQPTDEYQSTAGGKAFAAELIRTRQNAIDEFSNGCSKDSILSGLRAMRKTGLFLTNAPEEITSLREIKRELSCCIAWKPKVNYSEQNEFRSEYEEGTMAEIAKLKLQSSPRNMEEARWVGKWVYQFNGREGIGEGLSNATLKFRKGQGVAELKIGDARMRSSGRINLPISMSGEFRRLAVEGSPIFPFVSFSESVKIPLVGCHETK